MTAEVIMHWMMEHALGAYSAKTAEEIIYATSNHAAVFRPEGGFRKDQAAAVLHKLCQGVVVSCLRIHSVDGKAQLASRFYVHVDHIDRLDQEMRAAEVFKTMAGTRLPREICVTWYCPYAGGWEPSDTGDSVTTFPEGSKCCGSCTGTHLGGRCMTLSHGSRCARAPWLGHPQVPVNPETWLAIDSPSALNDVLQSSWGTARLIEAELRGRVPSVNMVWEHTTSGGTGESMKHHAKLSIVDSKNRRMWKVCLSGANRKMAKMRSTMAFLQCYSELLKAAMAGEPVNYHHVWVVAHNKLVRFQEGKETPPGDDSIVWLWCPVCSMWLNGAEQLIDHEDGTKHNKYFGRQGLPLEQVKCQTGINRDQLDTMNVSDVDVQEPVQKETCFTQFFRKWWKDICDSDDFDSALTRALAALVPGGVRADGLMKPHEDVQRLTATTPSLAAMQAFRSDLNYCDWLAQAAFHSMRKEWRTFGSLPASHDPSVACNSFSAKSVPITKLGNQAPPQPRGDASTTKTTDFELAAKPCCGRGVCTLCKKRDVYAYCHKCNELRCCECLKPSDDITEGWRCEQCEAESCSRVCAPRQAAAPDEGALNDNIINHDTQAGKSAASLTVENQGDSNCDVSIVKDQQTHEDTSGDESSSDEAADVELSTDSDLVRRPSFPPGLIGVPAVNARNQFGPVSSPPISRSAAVIGAASHADQSHPDIWNGAVAPAPVGVATRHMCAVARHHTHIYALPKDATFPGTKIVPMSQLRIALYADHRTRSAGIEWLTDEQLLNAFLADATFDDACKHNNVYRFARTRVDPTQMDPVDDRSRLSMLVRGEPCLVVRLKTERGARGGRFRAVR